MIFVDTNVLVYAAVEQDLVKHKSSIQLLKTLISNNDLNISTLVLQEYAFTLTKLNLDKSIIFNDIEFYQQFAEEVPKAIFLSAINLCKQIDYFKNINDVIHLKYAEQNCTEIMTYDRDFNKLKPFTALPINLLG